MDTSKGAQRAAGSPDLSGRQGRSAESGTDPWEPVVPFDRAAEAAQAELGEVIGRLNAAQTDLVALTERVIDDDLWAVAGVRSVRHWLTCFAGLSPSRARDLERIARRADLPRMRTALDAGELTVDQAAVVARHTPATHDAAVTEFAGEATVPQLRRALSRYSFAPDKAEEEPSADTASEGGAEEDTAQDAEADSGAPSGETDDRPGDDVPDPLDPGAAPPTARLDYRDGRFHLEFSASAEIGALVEQALCEAKDALFRQGHPRSTMGEAMAEIAARSLQFTGDVSASRLSHYRVYVHLDAEGGWLQAREALPEHVIRRMTCNGSLQPVWTREGHPVNVGRADRIVPDRTRRLVEDRDRGCRFPGCVSRYHLEVHHIRHWRDGGPTDTDNLACLCGFHHDAHHRGEFLIAGDANRPNGRGGLRFTTRHGGPIGPESSSPARVASRAEAMPRHRRTPTPARRYDGPSGERLWTRWVDFGPGTCPPSTAAPPPTPAPPRDATDRRDPPRSTDRSPANDPPPTGIPPDAHVYAQMDGWTYWTPPDAYERAGEDADLTGPAALAHVRSPQHA